MAASIRHNLLVILIVASCLERLTASRKSTPVTAHELLALVAGNALGENVAHEIGSRGLSFRPTDAYRTQLANAGADPKVLTALGKAAIGNRAAPADNKESMAQGLGVDFPGVCHSWRPACRIPSQACSPLVRI